MKGGGITKSNKGALMSNGPVGKHTTAHIESSTDALVKPDMKAVLARTHLVKDLHGFLLPVFEAISNGMHGIEARFGEKAAQEGHISIRFENPNDPARILISVTDNGVGLTDENYESFKTPFSGYKLKQNGRGFGRFIAFKVFSRVTYSTRYSFFNSQDTRTFRFDVNQKNEFIFSDSNPGFIGDGLRVEYDQPLTEWHPLIRDLSSEQIADNIGGHFLPHFLYKWLPRITIQINDSPQEDITQHFKTMFIQYKSGSMNIKIDSEDQEIFYSLTRVIKSKSYTNHCLLFSAADRIVGSPRDLSNKLGQPYFTDEKDIKYVVICVVRSPAFENRLNDARTSINLSSKIIEQIVGDVSNIIQSEEQDQIDKIKSTQSADLGAALRENPILRLGLKGKSISEYVAAKPNNWDAERFISDLAIERYRATHELSKQIISAAASADNYDKTVRSILQKIDSNKKEALAEYVIHRRSIISLVEAARRFDDDGRRAPEDVIHDLVFKRFSDNKALEYFEHNLWLIDDALSFLPYVSSDRAMHGRGRKKGDKISDLAFFDDSLVLGDNDGTTITIVEFKRPSRDDYKFGDAKNDPVTQVIDTLDQATEAGGITKTDGAHFVFSKMIRRFAFIIADTTPSLIKVLRRHDFKNDCNPKVWFRYKENSEIYIQAFGYDTLVENAKKRNQAFFRVLLDE